MPPIKNLFGFRKNKGLDKSIIQKNPYRNNIDLNKRQFIKKGLLGMAGLGGLALASKVAKAGGLVFNDGSTQAAGSLEGTSIKSTSETGGTKFLREDGDGTCSWQASGAGAAVSSVNVYMGSNQNITDATWTKLVFDTEVYDIGNEFDSSTNYRFTATVAGKYFISFTIRANLGSAHPWDNAIYVNGSAVADKRSRPGASVATSITCNTIRDLSASDYVEAFVYHSSSGGPYQVNAGPIQSYMTITKLA